MTTKQKWLFYVAGAAHSGGGHMMRSLQLALVMKKNALVDFLLDHDSSPKWREHLRSHGFNVLDHTAKPDTEYSAIWVDHYTPDLKILQTYQAPRAAIIDTPEQLQHGYTFTLSYTLQATTINGFAYALIDPAYSMIKKTVSSETRVTLCFGQTDSKRATRKILEILENYPSKLHINIICGRTNTDTAQIENISNKSKHSTHIIYAPDNMIKVLSHTDIFITSGGVSTLEACAANVRCITIATAENQVLQSTALAKQGAILYAGLLEEITQRSFLMHLKEITDASYYPNRCIDGKGAERLGKALLEWEQISYG